MRQCSKAVDFAAFQSEAVIIAILNLLKSSAQQPKFEPAVKGPVYYTQHAYFSAGLRFINCFQD